jgi:ribosomal protein L29
MRMAKKPSLIEKTDTELLALLKEKRETLRTLRFTAKTARVKDSSEPAKTRKDVARILTEMTRRAGSAQPTA